MKRYIKPETEITTVSMKQMVMLSLSESPAKTDVPCDAKVVDFAEEQNFDF